MRVNSRRLRGWFTKLRDTTKCPCPGGINKHISCLDQSLTPDILCLYIMPTGRSIADTVITNALLVQDTDSSTFEIAG